MKRCRTCNRTFTDPNLIFCTDDGTPLTTEEYAEEAPYRPPSYVPPSHKQRRAWPWVVGILGAFLLGAIGLTIAAAIFVPRMLRSRQSEQPIVVTTDNSNQNDNSKQNDNANRNDNANTDDAPPTEKDQVLAQLRDLENDWTVANFNADKKQLQRILADDYVGRGRDGGLEGKKEYINQVERDTRFERWEFTDLTVDLSGDRATLKGKLTLFSKGQEFPLEFTDKFVWRNGRWQATGSEVKELKTTNVNYQ